MTQRTEPHERLAHARAKAGYKSPREAAQAFGWNENTYKSRESGLRGFGTDEARRYAHSFNVSFFWLVTGEGSSDDRLHLPIDKKISEGQKVLDIGKRHEMPRMRSVITNVRLPTEMGGMVFEGSFCSPRYDAGDIIAFIPDRQLPEKAFDGEEVIAVFEDETEMLAKIFKHSDAGFYDLERGSYQTVRRIAILGFYRISLCLRRTAVRTMRDTSPAIPDPYPVDL